jgi:hypothetical protein
MPRFLWRFHASRAFVFADDVTLMALASPTEGVDEVCLFGGVGTIYRRERFFDVEIEDGSKKGRST